MSLDFTPAPAPAQASRRVLTHAAMEARLIVRNGEQLLLALVIPLGVLLVTRFFGERFGLDFATMTPSVLSLAMWSTCLTTLAIATGFERRYNVLERMAATPLGKPGVLLGKALSIAMIATGQAVVLTAAGLLLGWRPQPSLAALVVSALTALLAMATFAGLALIMAGSLRPEATLAVANLMYLVGMPLGILLPVSAYPMWAQPVLSLLPTAALGESMRAAADGVTLFWPLAVAAVWALVLSFLTRKVFSWTS
ncbi:ABC transporter permease [Tessaracoccus caeni]|uniref:ABC transporter permease n=1 Tax=Tessaracoccus caeni TaxID=3031239 RepID=UPI0023DC2D66|nr:ABC transporter permease [Tessaracoccus caeni]MDF1489504.1 ABC transporter permease [Tessaracoccus caeni]